MSYAGGKSREKTKREPGYCNTIPDATADDQRRQQKWQESRRCLTKRPSRTTEQICEGISNRLTNEEVAALVGIDDSTLTRWKKEPEFCGAIKRAQAIRKLTRLKRIEKGESGWQGTAWAMERQYPEQFGPPLVQLRRKAEEKTEMSNQELFRYLVESDAAIRRLTARD